MVTKQIINTNEINIGSMLILKNGKKVKVTGIVNSMLPTIDEIYLFKTNEGNIKPNEVLEICK